MLDNEPQKRLIECQALLLHKKVNIFTFTAICYNLRLDLRTKQDHDILPYTLCPFL